MSTAAAMHTMASAADKNGCCTVWGSISGLATSEETGAVISNSFATDCATMEAAASSAKTTAGMLCRSQNFAVKPPLLRHRISIAAQEITSRTVMAAAVTFPSVKKPVPVSTNIKS